MLLDIKSKGHVVKDDGRSVIYDINRSKWLSVARLPVKFGIPHRASPANRWMHEDTGIPTNIWGYDFVKDVVITSLVFKSATVGTGKFSITELSSGVHTVKYELNLTAQDSESIDDLNVDITVGNAICIRQDTGLFSYPGILLEVAYNYT